MIKKNKPALSVALCLLAVGLTTGAMSLHAMVNTYSGVCGPLTGIPGLLQRAGFVPAGKCKPSVRGVCSESLCKTTAGKAGHCKAEKDGHVIVCVCLPGVVSR